MKLKSPLAALLAAVMLFISISPAFSVQAASTLTELEAFSFSSQVFFAADFGGDELLTFSLDEKSTNDMYYLSVFDTATAALKKQKKIKGKSMPIDSVSECEVKNDGTYVLYDYYDGKTAVFNADLTLKKTGKCAKESYNYDSKGKDNPLVTSQFFKEKEFARYDRICDFSENFSAMAFYDDKSAVYVTEDSDVSSTLDYRPRRLLASLRDLPDDRAGIAVYDYNAKTVARTETRAFDKSYTYNSVYFGELGDGYAFFVVENDTLDSCCYTPFIWHYGAETPQSFSVTKKTEASFKSDNNALISFLKKEYGINILLNKLPSTYPTYWDEETNKEYGGVIKGAATFDTYTLLKSLKGYLSYFPKGFTKEMATFGGKKHSFDIYIDKEILGDAAAFANRYDGFLICFATEEFSPQFIPHEFLHLIDARIDDYLQNANLWYEEEWDRLNPKNFFYYADQDYQPKYFITSYAMSDPREDRADTFEYLFEAYTDENNPFAYNAVRKKAIYLSELIRAAYPSVQKLDFASWEHWITPYPARVKAKKTTESLKVYWSACRSAQYYQLQQYKSGKWVTVQNTNKRKLTLTGLPSGKAYYFRVRAWRKDGTRKVYSSWETLDTATVPQTPTKLKASALSGRRVSVKWKQVKRCSGYQIQFARDKKFKKVVATKKVGKSKKSYTGKNLTKGKTYYVRIRAYKVAGETTVYSPWTKAKSFKAK